VRDWKICNWNFRTNTQKKDPKGSPKSEKLSPAARYPKSRSYTFSKETKNKARVSGLA
jgi:hypothetical protein